MAQDFNYVVPKFQQQQSDVHIPRKGHYSVLFGLETAELANTIPFHKVK